MARKGNIFVTESTAVFADGSYYHEIGVGAWAFRIPAFDLLVADAGRGPSNTHFELLGAVFGLEAAVAQGARTLTLFTDCPMSRMHWHPSYGARNRHEYLPVMKTL